MPFDCSEVKRLVVDGVIVVMDSEQLIYKLNKAKFKFIMTLENVYNFSLD